MDSEHHSMRQGELPLPYTVTVWVWVLTAAYLRVGYVHLTRGAEDSGAISAGQAAHHGVRVSETQHRLPQPGCVVAGMQL